MCLSSAFPGIFCALNFSICLIKMLRHKSGLSVIDRTLDHMYLISSGVGLDVRLTSVGDRAHSDNDTGHFDMTGQPSDITLSLI